MEFKFKTNLNCNHCVKKVTPHLNSVPGIIEWSVDLNEDNKTLYVRGEDIDEDKIKISLENAGYNAEKI